MRAIHKGLKDLYALDLGTTKFCLASLREGQEGLRLASVSVPADGMRRGMIANVEDARRALDQLVLQGEKHLSDDIRRVVVGIAGSHLSGRRILLKHPIGQSGVSARDLQIIAENVEKNNVLNGREILHTIPVSYSVDGRPKVLDPCGLHGLSLEAEYFLIDADQSYLRDVVQVCNAAGLQVIRLYSEPIASASVTVPDHLKEVGIAMADIGGGTTDGILFRNGRPISIFTINIAGKMMTQDLAIGLNLPPDEAEKAKLYFGINRHHLTDPISVVNWQRESLRITENDVYRVLLPRIHELGGQISRALLPFRGSLGAGLFLTGGGSEVKGLPEYFQAKMGIPVFRTNPRLILNKKDDGLSLDSEANRPHPTKMATVLGLLNLEIGRLGDVEKHRQNTWSSRYLGPILNWLKELA